MTGVMTFAVELAWWQQTGIRAVVGLLAVLLPAGTLVSLFLFKMMSFMQSRLGPMEAGPFGSLQLLAEVGKFLQKEDILPRKADRVVFKAAPFVVLIGATLPSVLAEISFLTNAKEAAFLATDAYRDRIAEALFQAVSDYQSTLKPFAIAADDENSGPSRAGPATAG